MKYEITGGNLPVVTCYPEAGKTLITEKGSMSWMSDNMHMETKGGGIGKMLGRFVTRESMFQNRYTASLVKLFHLKVVQVTKLSFKKVDFLLVKVVFNYQHIYNKKSVLVSLVEKVLLCKNFQVTEQLLLKLMVL